MHSHHILIIEDDEANAKLIRLCLEKEGFHCTTRSSGEDGLSALFSLGKIDLVLLDISLPGIDGFETCRRLRQEPRFQDLPVMFLTGRDHIVDRVSGFDLGADDYIIKPFEIIELLMRVKAVLKRTHPSKDSFPIMYGKLNIDIARHQVKLNDQEVVLTPMEFKLLVTLIQRNGRVQTREQLLSDVWGANPELTTRTVDEHIVHIRKKLGTLGESIETVRGYGYRMKEDETN